MSLSTFYQQKQFKERSSSSVREKYVNDPAYTEDVRHLALPLRRNSGPELNLSGRSFSRSSGKQKQQNMDTIKSNTYDARPSRKSSKAISSSGSNTKDKRSNTTVLDSMSTCSSDNNLDEEVIFFTKRGQSLDRRGFSLDFIEQKRLSWFQKEFLRASGGTGNDISIDFGQLLYDRHSVDYVEGLDDEVREKLRGKKDGGSRSKPSQIQRQNATRVNSSTPPEDLYKKNSKNKSDTKQAKQKESSSRFQIGKRFLKGEIGIKSFNYYLIKEGLKSSKKKQKGNTTPLKAISKSEENIYEEIFFADKSLLEEEIQGTQSLEPLQTFVPISIQKDTLSYQQQEQQQQHNENSINFIDCALCVEQCTDKNCEICIKQQQLQDYSSGSGYGTITKDYVQTYALLRGTTNTNIDPENPYQTANVLQFQSYNPNNPNVYKIETTPVAFNSDYNPMSQYAEIGPPSVSMQQPPQQQLQQTIFYAQPTTITTTFNPVYGYDRTGVHLAKSSSSSDSIQQQRLIRPEHIYSQPNFSRR